MVCVNEVAATLSVVCESAVVGLPVVFQQMPRTFTEAPPSDVIVPPHFAVVIVMSDTVDVVTVGKSADDEPPPELPL